jgi:hypothetical protein
MQRKKLTVLRRECSPLRRMDASEEPVDGEASETFHLLVDRGQQLREDHIQFVARGADHLITELSDSIIEATQRHEKERMRLCT